MIDNDELTTTITELVRATPGVAEIYPARPLPLAVIDSVVQTALPALPTAQLVSVSSGAELTRVEIRIAVTETAPAADICRDVYAAIAEHLATRGVAQVEIKVTVARIE